MEYVRLGKSNLLVSRVAFGAMRLNEAGSDDDAAAIVRKAYDSGINFFDTSRKTPECEKLLGDSLFDIRKNVLISTSTNSKTSEDIKKDLEDSLMVLHTDFVDLYQLEVEKFLPEPFGADGIYQTLIELKSSKKVKNIGIVTTNYDTAMKAAEKKLFDTIQFPLNMLNYQNVSDLLQLCEANDIGFIGMQPLCGGVVENVPLAFGFLSQFESVIPIWGIKTMEELEQILYFNDHPPVIDEKFNADVENLRNFFN